MHLVHLLSPRLRQTRLPSFIARIATELYRHLLGWNFHPLVLSAFVAHPNVRAEPRREHSHIRAVGSSAGLDRVYEAVDNMPGHA